MILFKVTHSAKPQPAPAAGGTLHANGRLLVEGSTPFHHWTNESGDKYFLIGRVIGLRRGDGSLAPASSLRVSTDLAADPSKVSQIEGRFVVIKVGADGNCELWTDQFGKIDVYYQSSKDEVVIASSLALLPVASSGGALDQVAAAHSLTVYGSRPQKKHTYYQAVRRLGVNESLRLVAGKLESKVRPFTPSPIAEYGPHDLHLYAEIFFEAVRARSSLEMNIVSLSSGWDSTAILATLVHLYGNRKVRCVIARLRYSDRSGVINQFEIDRAKAVADYFSVPLDILEYDFGTNGAAYFAEAGDALRAHQLTSMSGLGNYRMYQHIAKSYPQEASFFTGEASDGAHNFGFSQLVTMFHPASYEFREYADKMGTFLFGPTFLKELYAGTQAKDPVWNMIRGSASGEFDEPAKDKKELDRQLLRSLFLRNNRTPFYSLSNSKLLTKRGGDTYQDESDKTYFADIASFGPENMYSWFLHLYNSFYWQAAPVRSRESMADIHGVTIANPFQDSALIDFLSAMPESWGRGLNLNSTKYPLKWMLSNKIDYPTHLQVGPHSYTYDVQHGFSISGELLHASSLTQVFRDALKKNSFIEALDAQLFNRAYIDGIAKAYVGGAELRGEELGDVFSLATHSAIGMYG